MLRRRHSFGHRFTMCLIGVSLLLVINADNQSDDEVENEHAFTYFRNTSKGPEKWGSLNPQWKSCQLGKFQSPIDLPKRRPLVLSKLGRLRRNYKPAHAVMKNRGHDIMVEWKGDAGGTIIGNTKYNLQQSHWHIPSEHTADGRRYNMELHMVHHSPEGKIAVIAILYQLGQPDPFLDKVLARSNDDINIEGVDLGVINPWKIKFGSRKYFRYEGSLTIPPCTEGVIWTLIDKVRTVSREQLRALREAVHDDFENNARPVQPLHQRKVYMYRP